MDILLTNIVKTPYYSTYKKLAVQWLNKHLCFVSSSVVADSLVLPTLRLGQVRNRQLLVGANYNGTDDCKCIENSKGGCK